MWYVVDPFHENVGVYEQRVVHSLNQIFSSIPSWSKTRAPATIPHSHQQDGVSCGVYTMEVRLQIFKVFLLQQVLSLYDLISGFRFSSDGNSLLQKKHPKNYSWMRNWKFIATELRQQSSPKTVRYNLIHLWHICDNK